MQVAGSSYARRFQTPTPERLACPARIINACRKQPRDLSIALARRNRIAAHSLRKRLQSGTKLNGPRSGSIGSIQANDPDYRPGHAKILGAGWLSVNMFWHTISYIIFGVRAAPGTAKNARVSPLGSWLARDLTAASATRHRLPRCTGQARAEPAARRQTTRRKKSRAKARRRNATRRIRISRPAIRGLPILTGSEPSAQRLSRSDDRIRRAAAAALCRG